MVKSGDGPPILHIIDTTGPGGAETVFLQVAEGMRRRGWPARTVVVGPGWVLDSVHRLGLPVDVVPTRGRLDWAYLQGLRRVVRRHGIALIHAHLFSPAVYGSLVGALTGVPVVATFHGLSDAQAGGVTRTLRHRLIRRQASMVCVSESLREALVRAGFGRRESIRVIHNGVSVPEFAHGEGHAVREDHGVPDDGILVGAVGNLREPKDFPTLIRAAAQLAGDRRLHFAIVGERAEPLYGELCRLRDELGLRDRLAFWGFRSDVPAVMKAFDVLVISSSSEGFSLAAIQAMAAGTPVVATRSGGPEQIISDGESGLLVPTGDPAALAGAVRRLIEEPELGRRLADRAAGEVVARFSLEATLDAYERLYETRLGLRAPRTRDGGTVC